MDPRALSWIYRVEGRGVFTDDSQDSGGPTWEGVTAPAVVGLRDEAGRLVFDVDGDGDVDGEDIRALAQLPEAEREPRVMAFYGRLWARMGFGVAWPWSLLLFDGAVHHGPQPGIKLLHDALDIEVAPGSVRIVGDRTLAAIRVTPLRATVERYAWHRSNLMRAICQRRAKDRGYLLGWLNRVEALVGVALA